MKKEFSKSRCFAWLGLLGSIIGLIAFFIYPIAFGYRIMNLVLNAGIIIYFTIILLRTYKKIGNIKIGKIILTISILAQSILMSLLLILSLGEFRVIFAITIIYYLILFMYVLKLFYGKGIYINNNIIVILTIGYIIMQLLCGFYVLLIIANSMSILLSMPYFYRYYNLVKGVKENG